MDHAVIRRELRHLETALRSARRQRLFAEPGWRNEIPDEPGVYAIWNKRTHRPEYIGETSNLRSRLGDFGRAVNHSFRQKLEEKFVRTTRTRAEFSRVISERYEVSFVTVAFGRKELEEYLILRWPDCLENRRAKRILLSGLYAWVKAYKFR